MSTKDDKHNDMTDRLEQAVEDMAMANALHSLGIINDADLQRARENSEYVAEAASVHLPIGDWLDKQLREALAPTIPDPVHQQIEAISQELQKLGSEAKDAAAAPTVKKRKRKNQAHEHADDQDQAQE